MNDPIISVITPSYNMLNYLKKCAASIADQSGVSLEHIIIDNDSSDGTVKWLEGNNNIYAIIEKDGGMYKAINKGLKLCKGDIFCYLNCDEQFLPDTLEKVYTYFKNNKDIDIVYGNTLVISENDDLIAFRKSIKPRYHYILAHYLYIYSCSLFFRRKIIDDGYYFSTSYKTISDALFVARLIKDKYRFGYINSYTSVFTYRKEGLSNTSLAKEEQQLIKGKTVPCFIRNINLLLLLARYTEKAIGGKYFQRKPLEYQIFINKNLENRTNLYAKNVTPFININ